MRLMAIHDHVKLKSCLRSLFPSRGRDSGTECLQVTTTDFLAQSFCELLFGDQYPSHFSSLLIIAMTIFPFQRDFPVQNLQFVGCLRGSRQG
jgi:hypothetical protein